MSVRLLAVLALVPLVAQAEDKSALRKSLLLHASFDKAPNADAARGDAKMYTAASLKRQSVNAGLPSKGVAVKKSDGKHSGYLDFTAKTKEVVFFKGGKNVPFASKGYDGSISFWLRLTPDADLPPGYVDPLQITDKKWNDASMFVDFHKDKPRRFRLGIFSDYKFWNPKDIKWDKLPEAERPLVTVSKPPFSRDRWTHIAFTYRGFNQTKGSSATLYLDGKSQGTLTRPQRFTWDPDKVVVMLGIGYVGGLDDLAIFDRALSAKEVGRLHSLQGGVGALK